MIMNFHELMPDSTGYTISDRFHATFRVFSFEYAKWFEAHRFGSFSCKQEANPIRGRSSLKKEGAICRVGTKRKKFFGPYSGKIIWFLN